MLSVLPFTIKQSLDMHPLGSMNLGRVALTSLEKFSEGHSASMNTVSTREEELGSLGGTPQQVWQPVIHSLAPATFTA